MWYSYNYYSQVYYFVTSYFFGHTPVVSIMHGLSQCSCLTNMLYYDDDVVIYALTLLYIVSP